MILGEQITVETSKDYDLLARVGAATGNTALIKAVEKPMWDKVLSRRPTPPGEFGTPVHSDERNYPVVLEEDLSRDIRYHMHHYCGIYPNEPNARLARTLLEGYNQTRPPVTSHPDS